MPDITFCPLKTIRFPAFAIIAIKNAVKNFLTILTCGWSRFRAKQGGKLFIDSIIAFLI
jgi:hypothetical protein